MIRSVKISRFKRFEEVEFTLPRHIVLAGPNNTGKTTMLQAVAAWSLAFERWRTLNDFQRHGGFYTKMPITRQQFSAVPLSSFDLLWRDRSYRGSVVIKITSEAGWSIPLEFMADSTEQVYVRPLPRVEPSTLRDAALSTVFIPPMTGLGTDEPVYTRPKVDQLLGQAKPGDVLRNLLVEANGSGEAWQALCTSIRDLFGYELLPPDDRGAHILAEYCHHPDGPRFDIASAGSGFQQVLMLLTFLHTHPASVLLLDEPDAHLHVILQDAIFGELRRAAFANRSQLVIATHSEVIIDAVDPENLCVMLQTPRLLATSEERRSLISSLRVLSNVDIMLAEAANGILYLEGSTDLELLRAWARALAHPAHAILTTQLYWRATVFQSRSDAPGIHSRDHYAALKMIRNDLPGFEILDRDANPDLPATEIVGKGLQRRRWNRYESESYLVHPQAMRRFVEHMLGGPEVAASNILALEEHFRANYPPAFLSDPLGDHPFLTGVKARTDLIPRALDAAGVHGVPYTEYHQIAGLMTPEEIHHDVQDMFDSLCTAFGQA